jgi:dolichol kinase
MLAVIACLAGIFAILVISEILYKQKILEGEYLRKFIHISSGIFITFWPWLISWRQIQAISLGMLFVVIFDYRSKASHLSGDIKRLTYGVIFFPLGVLACALLTDNKIFFALAVLHLALADGLAAVIGTAYGKKFEYRAWHQLKTLAGTMTFWIVSVCILGTGLLFLHDSLSFSHYVFLLMALPPALAILENLAVFGTDNIVVPVAVVLALQLAI